MGGIVSRRHPRKFVVKAPPIVGQTATIFELAKFLTLGVEQLDTLFDNFCTLDIKHENVLQAKVILGINNEECSTWPQKMFLKDVGKNVGDTFNFEEYLVGVWNFCSASSEVLARSLFDLFDEFEEGKLEEEKFVTLIDSLWGKRREAQYVAMMKGIHDVIRGNEITLNEFLVMVSQSPSLLVSILEFQNGIREETLGMEAWIELAFHRQKRFLNRGLQSILEEYLSTVNGASADNICAAIRPWAKKTHEQHRVTLLPDPMSFLSITHESHSRDDEQHSHHHHHHHHHHRESDQPLNVSFAAGSCSFSAGASISKSGSSTPRDCLGPQDKHHRDYNTLVHPEVKEIGPLVQEDTTDRLDKNSSPLVVFSPKVQHHPAGLIERFESHARKILNPLHNLSPVKLLPSFSVEVMADREINSFNKYPTNTPRSNATAAPTRRHSHEPSLTELESLFRDTESGDNPLNRTENSRNNHLGIRLTNIAETVDRRHSCPNFSASNQILLQQLQHAATGQQFKQQTRKLNRMYTMHN